MNSKLVDRIVHTLLYEGSMLYPYRSSAIKNRRRWNFGVLAPKVFSDAHAGTEAWMMQTECLLRNPKHARLDVTIRFLHLVLRSDQGADRTATSPDELLAEPSEEAVERNVSNTVDCVTKLATEPREFVFQFPEKEETATAGKIANQPCTTLQQALKGCIEISAEIITPQLARLRVRVKNLTEIIEVDKRTRDDILLRSFVSTHTLLNVQDGEFVSQLDPPDDLREIAAASKNLGCWPVLVGSAEEKDCMLAAPIILYDYPQVASESAGDFYDSTEIDELLTLRVLTLTDEEKAEIREGDDERARDVLERTESLPWEHLARVHGAVRGLGPIKDKSLD